MPQHLLNNGTPQLIVHNSNNIHIVSNGNQAVQVQISQQNAQGVGFVMVNVPPGVNGVHHPINANATYRVDYHNVTPQSPSLMVNW
jgi:hypothetical protein